MRALACLTLTLTLTLTLILTLTLNLALTLTLGDGSGVCAQCPPGTRGNSTRASTAAAACVSCAPGKYSSLYGATDCLPCPAGFFCADGWSLDETQLLVRASPLNAIPLPIGCPAGTYSPHEHNRSPEDCIACPPGLVAPHSGGTTLAGSCVPCAPGSAQGNPGMPSCYLCVPSQAQPSAGQPHCAACAPGKYSDTDGATACQPCPLGSFRAVPGGRDPTCEACERGSYGDVPGAARCKLCPANTASNTTRAVSNASCAACDASSFAEAGAALCTPCATAVITATLRPSVSSVSSPSLIRGAAFVPPDGACDEELLSSSARGSSSHLSHLLTYLLTLLTYLLTARGALQVTY